MISMLCQKVRQCDPEFLHPYRYNHKENIQVLYIVFKLQICKMCQDELPKINEIKEQDPNENNSIKYAAIL